MLLRLWGYGRSCFSRKCLVTCFAGHSIYANSSFIHNPIDATTSKVNLYIYNYLQFGICLLRWRSCICFS